MYPECIIKTAFSLHGFYDLSFYTFFSQKHFKVILPFKGK